jgi:RNA recognition motif-containing protein
MRIFVGNLPWATTEEALRQLCAPYGFVAGVRIARNRGSRQSRGFGFVEMPDPAEAQAAINGLNGTTLEGRPLTVSQAHQQAEAPPQQERRPRW